jgi:hypothetical protein
MVGVLFLPGRLPAPPRPSTIRLCVHTRGSLSGPAENFFTLYQGDAPEIEDPDRCLNY